MTPPTLPLHSLSLTSHLDSIALVLKIVKIGSCSSLLKSLNSKGPLVKRSKGPKVKSSQALKPFYSSQNPLNSSLTLKQLTCFPTLKFS